MRKGHAVRRRVARIPACSRSPALTPRAAVRNRDIFVPRAPAGRRFLRPPRSRESYRAGYKLRAAHEASIASESKRVSGKSPSLTSEFFVEIRFARHRTARRRRRASRSRIDSGKRPEKRPVTGQTGKLSLIESTTCQKIPASPTPGHVILNAEAVRSQKLVMRLQRENSTAGWPTRSLATSYGGAWVRFGKFDLCLT